MARLDIGQFVHLAPQRPEVRPSERELTALRALQFRVEPDASKARIPPWRRILHVPPPLPFE